MSVALHLDPYEFVDTDPSYPDDLSDVDLDHPNFRAAFPDGKVPIRHVPMPRAGLGDGFWSWAENVLAVHEQCSALTLDVDALSFARERLVDYEVLGGDQSVELTKASLLERKEHLAELLVGGLTLRQCARYLGWSNADVVECATSAAMLDRVDGVISADEDLALGVDSMRKIAMRYGLKPSLVESMARLRRGESYNSRACARAQAA